MQPSSPPPKFIANKPSLGHSTKTLAFPNPRDSHSNHEFLAANNATNATIVATTKLHRQQAFTSSFNDDTCIPKSARVAFKLNASETVTGTPNV
jgi:hypothetical protein